MCVYFYYSIYLFARARVCVCAAYWKRFSPTNNKNNRNIKASVILGFRASFPRTRTHCPIYRCKLDICFGCYSFYAIGAGEKFERRMCVRARFRTICTIVFAIISNWWFSRTISIFEKMLHDIPRSCDIVQYKANCACVCAQTHINLGMPHSRSHCHIKYAWCCASIDRSPYEKCISATWLKWPMALPHHSSMCSV